MVVGSSRLLLPIYCSSILLCLLGFIVHGGMSSAMVAQTAFDVGLVIDSGSLVGKMSKTSIYMAIEDFYAAHANYTTKVVLHERDSHDVIGAATAALDLIKNQQVQAIIGPQRSSEALFVSDLGNKSQVPIISFSATSPSLSPTHSPFFLRTALNDSSQSTAIAALLEHFGWREAVPIYEDTNYGAGAIPSLIDALTEANVRVPYRSVISPTASDDQIMEELYKLMTMQTRVFVVHMSSSNGGRLFLKAREAGMLSEGYAWIVSDGLTNLLDSFDDSVIDSMQGVLGVRPYVPRTRELKEFTARWKRRLRRENPGVEMAGMSIFALWAHDTVQAVAVAAEKVGRAGLGFAKPVNGSTDLETMGVSERGAELLDAMRWTSFVGLSGEFRIVDGQLQSSAFEILNVVGRGGRGIGFWTLANGLSRKLDSPGSRVGLVVWPGESWAVPKGWVVPTTGKKLRVGVPVKHGFQEFVEVRWDNGTNTTTVDGYCIDVFKEVMQSLPYAVPYEFVPFARPNRTSAGTYNDMVYQVFLGNFDVVVADTTIVENRSRYVDFTLPYTESGVSMIVPIKYEERKNAWIFLKPLTTDLWVISLAFFFYTGFVVWLIEHRINEEFRGDPSKQFGTIFYFAFSTLFFAHREKVLSNLSRLVVIIWMFFVLILTSSYTASLASLLTVQKLRPMVTDVKELINHGKNVGYQEGSYIADLLKRIGFHESKLRPYSTIDDYVDALSKGTTDGGIDALFDEMLYIKIFLAEHCSDYMMIGLTYKADGYGFVFPRGSPLVADVSRAILNVTQGDGMNRNEKKWFGNLTTCDADGRGRRATGISFRSFWGLFLITGSTTTLALLVSIILYMKENWDELKVASGDSVWRSLVAVSRHYDKPHPSMRRTPTFVDGKFFDVGRDHVVDIDGRRSDDDGLRSFVSNLGRSGELLSPSVENRMSWEVGSTRGDGAPPAHGEMV